jgi:2'-5' RNA ligase
MIDHWWWRPGWRIGRRFYMWYVTFDRDDAVRDLALAYARRLRLPTLDVIPPQWLHVTMLGVGFVDQIDEAEAQRIADAARQRLARLAPITVQIGPATVDREVVRLDVTPAEPVIRLRQELLAAIADVWGADRAPEPDDGFFPEDVYLPHVSLAYSNTDAERQSVMDEVRRDEPAPVRTTLRRADLVAVHRDNRMYEWTGFAHADLGRPARPRPDGLDLPDGTRSAQGSRQVPDGDGGEDQDDDGARYQGSPAAPRRGR